MGAYSVGFHAWFSAADSVERLREKVTDWLAASAFTVSAKDPLERRDTYRREDQTLYLGLGASSETGTQPQIVVSIHQRERDEVWPFLPELLVSFCERTHPRLLRCSAGEDTDYLLADEMEGNLHSLGFFVYLSAPLVEKFGQLRLLLGPFYKVYAFENGGCGLQCARGVATVSHSIFRSARDYMQLTHDSRR